MTETGFSNLTRFTLEKNDRGREREKKVGDKLNQAQLLQWPAKQAIDTAIPNYRVSDELRYIFFLYTENALIDPSLLSKVYFIKLFEDDRFSSRNKPFFIVMWRLGSIRLLKSSISEFHLYA